MTAPRQYVHISIVFTREEHAAIVDNAARNYMSLAAYIRKMAGLPYRSTREETRHRVWQFFLKRWAEGRNQPVSISDVARYVKIHKDAAARHTRYLAEDGVLVSVGGTGKRPRYIFNDSSTPSTELAAAIENGPQASSASSRPTLRTF